MKVYSMYEICEILNVSRKTITKYITSGELKAIRLGNKIRVTETALEEFLESKSIEVKKRPIDVLKKK